jgi:hypothetical protein
MNHSYSIYCDESCHLENDRHDVMVLGAVWCSTAKVSEIASRIREIKKRHGITYEVKWTKISPAKVNFYLDLLDYFFDDDDLHFRALIAPDKSLLRHNEFDQNHDDWYYKMYFDMLKVILQPDARYYIYLDYKDTQGGAKAAKLHDVLCNNFYDFSRQIIRRLQTVHSDEVQLIQLADILIGTISYANRGLTSSRAKQALVKRMRDRSGYELTRTTLYREDKVNLFRWQARNKYQ